MCFTCTHHTAAHILQVTLAGFELDMSCLYGPVTLVGGLSTWPPPGGRYRHRCPVYPSNMKSKFKDKKREGLAAPTGSQHGKSKALDKCNFQKWCPVQMTWISLQRGSLCRDHNPGIHILNKRNWRSRKSGLSVCGHSPLDPQQG